MSITTDAWDELYAAQTAVTGINMLATITGLATSAPAIISETKLDDVLLERGGGSGEAGGYSLQMRISDFSDEPPKRTPITANGPAQGLSLQIESVNRNNGIFYIHAVDYSALR